MKMSSRLLDSGEKGYNQILGTNLDEPAANLGCAKWSFYLRAFPAQVAKAEE